MSELEQLRVAVDQLTARVAELERRLAAAPEITPRTAASVAQPPPSASINPVLGVKLINRIGALTLAIGIVFFFKYAVDNRWIGALGRVLLGLIAGAFLIGLGDWLRRRNQQVFAQGVAGCGLAVVFISIYAAFAYYQLVGQTFGFVALVLTCGFAVVLSVLYDAVSIAALGFVGAVLTTLLLRTTGPPPLALHFPYLLIVPATAVFISSRQHWVALTPITTGLALLAAIVLINETHPTAFILFCTLLAALHFGSAAFAATTGIRDSFYLVGHAALLFACIRAVALWALHNSAPVNRANLTSELESFLLAAYGGVVLLAALFRKTSADRALATVLLGLVVAKLYLWDVWQLKRFYLISAFVALGVLLLAASFLFSRFRSTNTS